MGDAAKESSLDARVGRTREALRAAIIALTQEKEFDSLTVRAISRQAGIGYATFFRHYPDKQTLLADASEGLIVQLLGRLSPMVLAGEGAEAMLALARFVEENRLLCRALLIGGGERVRAEVTRRAVALAARAPSTPPDWLPADLAVTHLVHAALTIIGWWLRQEEPLPAPRIATILDRLVLAPVKEGPSAGDRR